MSWVPTLDHSPCDNSIHMFGALVVVAGPCACPGEGLFLFVHLSLRKKRKSLFSCMSWMIKPGGGVVFSELINGVALVIALAGMIIVLWGVLLTVVEILKMERRNIRGEMVVRKRNAIRHSLGTYLLLGLEFLVAADIVRTVIHPTLQEVAVLGAIVLIRTVIGFALDTEMAEAPLNEE